MIDACHDVPAAANNAASAHDIDTDKPQVSLSRLEGCVADFSAGRGKAEDNKDVPIAEVRKLVDDVVSAIALQLPPTVVPCQGQNDPIEAQAISIPVDRTGDDGRTAQAGEYIVYDPTWVHRMVGADRPQLIALFGHEIGHLKSQDWNAGRAGVPQVQKEEDADRFAGCAVARLSADIDDPEALFERLRDSEASDHPSRLAALAALRGGYTRCGGRIAHVCRTPSNGIEGYADDRTIQGDSGERSGGGGQDKYCNEFVGSLKLQYPGALVDIISHSESSSNGCSPFNCPHYRYFCTVHFKNTPVYRREKSKDCLQDDKEDSENEVSGDTASRDETPRN